MLFLLKIPRHMHKILTSAVGKQSEIYLSPGQVAFNHGFKFRYTYNEDDKKHKVKTRFGKTH